MSKMIFYVISIIVNIIYFVVLRIELYTDRYHLPDGIMGEHHRSPIDSLYTAGNPALVYLQFLFMAFSIVSAILLLIGVRNRIVGIAHIAATIASTVIFVIIMIVSGFFIHPHY